MTTAEQVTQSEIRSQDEVVNRALALMVVAGKAVAGNDVGRILMDRFGVQAFMSPLEVEFMADANPEHAARAYFSWRYECLNVLLWALGVVDRLAPPSGICDVDFIDNTMLELEAHGLRKSALLRPPAEIEAAQDRIFNEHWAVRDAQIFNKPIPGGMDPEVVYERHYAINWLAGNEDWDSVSTDT
jgi:hypothetical protein